VKFSILTARIIPSGSAFKKSSLYSFPGSSRSDASYLGTQSSIGHFPLLTRLWAGHAGKSQLELYLYIALSGSRLTNATSTSSSLPAPRLSKPAAQLFSHARMASKTEGSDVFNSAFTTAFDDRHNMVGRPGANKRLEPWELQPKHIERPVTLRLAVDFPGELRRLKPRLSQQCLKDPHDLIAIGSTKRADPEITLKDLFP
jgi:hypothetical protein